MGKRRVRRTAKYFAVFVAALLVVMGTGSAVWASWGASNTTGGGGNVALSLNAPVGTTPLTSTSSTITVAWSEPSGGAPPAYYTVTRCTGTSCTPGTISSGGCATATHQSSTSCSDSGLASGQTYTYVVTAFLQNWSTASLSFTGTTSSVAVSATLVGSATDTTSGSSASSVSNVTTSNGASLIVLVYRQASASGMTVSSVSGTAISGTPTQITSQAFNNDSKYGVWAFQASGSGTANGTVVVTFGQAKNTKTIVDVVQLGGNNVTTPVAHSAISVDGSAGTTVTGGTLTGASSTNGEIFFTGLVANTTMTTPSGYSRLDAPISPATALTGSWFNSSASSTGVGTSLGASSHWGTIEVEINHA